MCSRVPARRFSIERGLIRNRFSSVLPLAAPRLGRPCRMTTTYDPFIPADGTDQRRYDGRRRAEERDGGSAWDAEPRWEPQYQEPRYQEPQYQPPQQYAEPRWNAEPTP